MRSDGNPARATQRQGGAAVGEPGDGPLAERTKAFALAIVRLYCGLPRTTVAQVLGRQLLRSGTSVGAQYREATRARSPAEFISKIESALQELEETRYWLELLSEAGVVPGEGLAGPTEEARQLTAMLASSAKTAKGRNARGASVDRRR